MFADDGSERAVQFACLSAEGGVAEALGEGGNRRCQPSGRIHYKYEMTVQASCHELAAVGDETAQRRRSRRAV
ncbi:MAG: hypothetical protein E6J42_09900 [Chloroflexi bacterium]|nr:MAG: hypothetical protein E6J42_09900 [Chloroflexota bacterium]